MYGTLLLKQCCTQTVLILKHHLPDSGGHLLPRVVIPDEFRVLVSSLKYMYCCLRIVSHGIHEHTRKETNQS